jgi:DNA-binding IclR family transcriptional regulator
MMSALPRSVDPGLIRWLERIRAEYVEIPGLKLTLRQARRLWGLDETTTGELLGALVDVGFLRQSSGGTYVRASSY